MPESSLLLSSNSDSITETWLPVVGFENAYSVSDQGRVRSEPGGHRRAQILRQTASQKRPSVSLFKYGISHPRRVHHLVAEAFIGPRPPGLHVLHWDDDMDNNRVENLRYGTPSENQFDSARNQTHHNVRKTHCPQSHEYTPDNCYLYRNRRYCRTCQKNRSKTARSITQK